jgi:TolA-binding protein
MVKEIEIGKLNEIYKKYGDLGFEVDTPYGFHDITWCGITEENAEVYRCELENGLYVEGADYHRLKKEDGEFEVLKNIEIGTPIQVRNGISNVKSIKLLNERDTLYDIQVDKVHQYYSNDIVSHNTTLTIDAIKFLFFGTTTKTDKNEQVFNQFSENNDLLLRAMIQIEGDDEIIIERHLKRKAKRKGGWTIENKLNYYTILPDGDEELMNDEDATKTTNLIKETVGTESDFDLVVLATSRNLDTLVDSTSGESGKLLTRFIGLEIISLKETAARKMYSAFSKSMKSNIYDVDTLDEEISEHQGKIDELNSNRKNLDIELEDQKAIQIKLNEEKINLISSKEKIDAKILTLNPSKLNQEIAKITETGVGYKKEISELKVKIKEIGEVKFDEDRDFDLTKQKTSTSSNIAVIEAEIIRLGKVVDDLIAGGICQACNRALDDVDNTEHINTHKAQIGALNEELMAVKIKLSTINVEIEKLSAAKAKINEKNKLELRKDRVEVEIGSLRNSLKSKNGDLAKYNENVSGIDKNAKLDSEISIVDTKLIVCEREKESINNKIQSNGILKESNNKDITLKTDLIKTINKELEVDKVFRVYIDMVGKKGISKLVLRSVLPIINSEIQRLLDDITDFDVEVFVDDKNEVRYLLIKDGVEKPLKSGSGFELTAASIALRCVLGKMSNLPKPNFIAFDEVLGRVAPENISAMRPLFERITDMFDIVFFITQNDLVKDWANQIVTVIKDNNISKIKTL